MVEGVQGAWCLLGGGGGGCEVTPTLAIRPAGKCGQQEQEMKLLCWLATLLLLQIQYSEQYIMFGRFNIMFGGFNIMFSRFNIMFLWFNILFIVYCV